MEPAAGWQVKPPAALAFHIGAGSFKKFFLFLVNWVGKG